MALSTPSLLPIRSAVNERPSAEGIAVGDAAGKLYATSSSPEGSHIAVIPQPVPGPPTITEGHVSNIEPTTATIHAVVDPEGYDTHYHFQYVDQASYEHEGGFSSQNTRSTSSTDLGLVIEEDSSSRFAFRPSDPKPSITIAPSSKANVNPPIRATSASSKAQMKHLHRSRPSRSVTSRPRQSVQN